SFFWMKKLRRILLSRISRWSADTRSAWNFPTATTPVFLALTFSERSVRTACVSFRSEPPALVGGVAYAGSDFVTTVRLSAYAEGSDFAAPAHNSPLIVKTRYNTPMNERDFFNERQETKTANFSCPFCRE